MNPDLVRVPADRGPLEEAGESYERAITDAGGIDLQVLGIGRTGHIGFNEPGSSFASLTRVKTLTEQTRLDNARFFPSLEDVPTHCVTPGLGTIMRAKRLVLLAFGEAKADAVAGAVEGPVTSSLPGSAIQLHQHVTVILDDAAAANLAHADYYRYAWDHRLGGSGSSAERATPEPPADTTKAWRTRGTTTSCGGLSSAAIGRGPEAAYRVAPLSSLRLRLSIDCTTSGCEAHHEEVEPADSILDPDRGW